MATSNVNPEDRNNNVSTSRKNNKLERKKQDIQAKAYLCVKPATPIHRNKGPHLTEVSQFLKIPVPESVAVFPEQAIRLLKIDGQTYFVASDIVSAMWVVNDTVRINKNLSEDEYITAWLPIELYPHQPQAEKLVGTTGLLKLLHDPYRRYIHLPFQKWIMEEVYVSVLQHGTYPPPQNEPPKQVEDPALSKEDYVKSALAYLQETSFTGKTQLTQIVQMLSNLDKKVDSIKIPESAPTSKSVPVDHSTGLKEVEERFNKNLDQVMVLVAAFEGKFAHLEARYDALVDRHMELADLFYSQACLTLREFMERSGVMQFYTGANLSVLAKQLYNFIKVECKGLTYKLAQPSSGNIPPSKQDGFDKEAKHRDEHIYRVEDMLKFFTHDLEKKGVDHRIMDLYRPKVKPAATVPYPNS